jgi:hypothetical protein
MCVLNPFLVLFKEEGGVATAKLIDFGLARKCNTGSSAPQETDFVSSGACALNNNPTFIIL